MQKKQNSGNANIIPYPRTSRVNVGMIIFAIIFLYIVFSVYSYMTREQIRYYEVLKGGIVRQEQFTGVAIREEQSVSAVRSGHVHYYIQEGKRVGVGSDVYTIDETGSLESYLSDHPELTSELTGEQMADIRRRLSSFSRDFRNGRFSELYDVKYSLDASALEYSSLAGVQDMDRILSERGIVYSSVRAEHAGVVSYAIDGYEAITEDNVNDDIISMNGYQKRITKPGEIIDEGSPVYKLITSSEWKIVFPVTDDFRMLYGSRKTLKVRFPDKDLSEEAAFRIYTAQDGKDYGCLTLHEMMEEFCGDRYIRFEIISGDDRGLKIPRSSVTEKEFYVVPRDFLEIGPDGSEGFFRTTVGSDGTGISTEFVSTEIYRIDAQFCYLNIPDDRNPGRLRGGDFLIKKGTEQTYQIGPTKSIQGVYNINKGYCIFRQIVPLEANNEYIIVEEATDYGISVYDHIVLNAALVHEGQLVYQ